VTYCHNASTRPAQLRTAVAARMATFHLGKLTRALEIDAFPLEKHCAEVISERNENRGRPASNDCYTGLGRSLPIGASHLVRRKPRMALLVELPCLLSARASQARVLRQLSVHQERIHQLSTGSVCFLLTSFHAKHPRISDTLYFAMMQ
jgi:hypothetical protein